MTYQCEYEGCENNRGMLNVKYCGEHWEQRISENLAAIREAEKEKFDAGKGNHAL